MFLFVSHLVTEKEKREKNHTFGDQKQNTKKLQICQILASFNILSKTQMIIFEKEAALPYHQISSSRLWQTSKQ